MYVPYFLLPQLTENLSIKKYSNVEFLSSLCAAMTAQLPKLRPSAAEALVTFRKSILDHRGVGLRWRLRDYNETRLKRIIGDFRSAFKELVYQIKPPFSFCEFPLTFVGTELIF